MNDDDDMIGLGDNDIADFDRKKREEIRRRNPNNEAEVALEMWTLANLTRGQRVVKKVVYGVVSRTFVDNYLPGEIVCSAALFDIHYNEENLVCVTQRFRYECTGPGREITIPEHALDSYLPDPDADPDDIKRRIENNEL